MKEVTRILQWRNLKLCLNQICGLDTKSFGFGSDTKILLIRIQTAPSVDLIANKIKKIKFLNCLTFIETYKQVNGKLRYESDPEHSNKSGF